MLQGASDSGDVWTWEHSSWSWPWPWLSPIYLARTLAAPVSLAKFLPAAGACSQVAETGPVPGHGRRFERGCRSVAGGEFDPVG